MPTTAREIVATDARWRESTGPILKGDFYNGCLKFFKTCIFIFFLQPYQDKIYEKCHIISILTQGAHGSMMLFQRWRQEPGLLLVLRCYN